MAGTGWEHTSPTAMRGPNPPLAAEEPAEAAPDGPTRGRLAWEQIIFGERSPAGPAGRAGGVSGAIGPPLPSWVMTGLRHPGGSTSSESHLEASAASVLGPVLLGEGRSWRNTPTDPRSYSLPEKQGSKKRRCAHTTTPSKEEIIDFAAESPSIRAMPGVPVHEPRPRGLQKAGAQPDSPKAPLSLPGGLRSHRSAFRPGQALSGSHLSSLALQLRGAPLPAVPQQSDSADESEPAASKCAQSSTPTSQRPLRRRPVRFMLNSGQQASAASSRGGVSGSAASDDSEGTAGLGPAKHDQKEQPKGAEAHAKQQHCSPTAGGAPSAAVADTQNLGTRELVQFLQEERDRLRTRFDEDMLDAHLDALAAQEEQEEEQEMRRWRRPRRPRPASYEEYLRSLSQASAAQDSRPSIRQRLSRLPVDPRRQLGGLSSAEHAWTPIAARSPVMATPGASSSAVSHTASLGDFMFLGGGGMGSHMQHLQFLSNQVQAIRQVRDGRLPAHLLLSDRDFDENDYEALLALDEGIENHKGAKKEVIEALPTEVCSGGAESNDAETTRCIVCLEDHVKGDLMRLLPCSHRFHKACIDQWLAVKACCPICQADIREEHREAAAPASSILSDSTPSST